MKRIIVLLALPVLAFLFACNNSKPESESAAQTAEIVFLTNIHCDGCVNSVQSKLPDTEGIIKAVAALESKLVTVTYDPSKIDTAGLITALTELGYDAHVYTNSAAPVLEEAADTAEIVN